MSQQVSQSKRKNRKSRSAGASESNNDLTANSFNTFYQQNMDNMAGPKSRPSSSMSDRSRAGGSNHGRISSMSNGGVHSRTPSRQTNRDSGRDSRSEGARNGGNGRADSRASTRGQNSGSKKGYANNNNQITVNGTIDPTQKYNMNYYVLQQHDPKLGQIFYTTTVGSIYIYDDETEEWNKSYCQGPLFLYSRVLSENDDNGDSPTDSKDCSNFAPYALMALNRLSMTNFSLAVTPRSVAAKHGVETMSIYKDGDFLIVHSPEEVTYCIYLYKEEERKSILDGVEWCLDVTL